MESAAKANTLFVAAITEVATAFAVGAGVVIVDVVVVAAAAIVVAVVLIGVVGVPRERRVGVRGRVAGGVGGTRLVAAARALGAAIVLAAGAAAVVAAASRVMAVEDAAVGEEKGRLLRAFFLRGRTRDLSMGVAEEEEAEEEGALAFIV